MKFVVSLGALATAIVAIAGAVELIRGGDTPPPRLGGEITKLEFAQRQKLGDYCRDVLKGKARQKCLRQPFVDELGFVFYVQVQLVGYRGPCCELRYTLLNRQQLEVPGFTRVQAVANVTPEGIDDEGGWLIWVGNPPVRDFVVRFDLRKGDGGLLGSRRVPVHA